MRTLAELRTELGSAADGPLGIDEYQHCAARTYRSQTSGADRLQFLLLGLFGEVGSLLSELKKKQRDRSAYRAYGSSSLEETGDVLWYLANVAGECGLSLAALANRPDHDRVFSSGTLTLLRDLQPQDTLFHEPASADYVQRSLLALAGTVGLLVERARGAAGTPDLAPDLGRIFAQLVVASSDAQISLADAAQANLDKLLARWPLKAKWGSLLDADDDPAEQLPRLMRVRFEERRVGQKLYVFQSMNGVNLGDRLTDNSAEKDDYRFHDVFHLAFAAFLGWSPVLRSLLKLKRRSRPEIDEHQDGARAGITEEGLSNWIFAHGLRHEAFAHVDSLDFALLRTIAQMVKGYEVEVCAPWMWERAILESFSVFRALRKHRGGFVVADLAARSLTFEAVS